MFGTPATSTPSSRHFRSTKLTPPGLSRSYWSRWLGTQQSRQGKIGHVEASDPLRLHGSPRPTIQGKTLAGAQPLAPSAQLEPDPHPVQPSLSLALPEGGAPAHIEGQGRKRSQQGLAGEHDRRGPGQRSPLANPHPASGGQRGALRLPADPQMAVDRVIERFQIPWLGALEKSVRIFINKELLEAYKKSGRRLAKGDKLSFIPISGGG